LTSEPVRHRIADLERDEHDRLRLLDLWNYQRKKLPARTCSRKKTRSWKARSDASNAERVRTAPCRPTMRCTRATPRRGSIRAATRQIEELSRFDEQFRDAVPELESARITIEDIGASCVTTRRHRRFSRAPRRSGRPAGGARPAEAQVWPKLEDVTALGEELERKLNEMENKDEVLASCAPSWRLLPNST